MRTRILAIAILGVTVLVTLAPAIARGDGAKVSRAEAEAFSKKWTESLSANDIATAAKLFNFAEVIDTATTGMTVPPELRTALLAENTKIIQPIANGIKDDGSYELVHIREVQGNFRPLLRLISSTGLNYHELTLAKDPAGTVQIVDFLVYITGEPITQTLRRTLLPVIAGMNQGAVSKLVHGESEYLKHMPEGAKMGQQFQAKDFAGVVATYRALPDEMRKDKTWMLLYTAAVEHAEPANYLNAVHAYETAFPGDPSGLLVSIDGLFMEKKYDDVSAQIEKLDKKLGGDPYLNLYRGNIAEAKGNYSEAIADIQKVTKAEPKMRFPWGRLITIAVQHKDYAGTAKWLTESEHAAGFNWANVPNTVFYSDFVRSPEGKKWLATRSKTTPQAESAAPAYK